MREITAAKGVRRRSFAIHLTDMVSRLRFGRDRGQKHASSALLTHIRPWGAETQRRARIAPKGTFGKAGK